MKTNLSVIGLYLLCVTACGGGSGAGISDNVPINVVVEARVWPDDHEVMTKAYDIQYQVPDYFFVDERAFTPGSFSLYHVKDVTGSYELCTNDYQQALDWEATDNNRRAVGGDFVGSVETDRYFEFVRELSFTNDIGNITAPTSSGLARVFKCNYIDRADVNRNLRDGYAGTLNKRPLSGNEISVFSEYMWQFTFFWPVQKKVLETFSTELPGTYQHTLLLALVTNQGADRCDLIEVVDWVFSMNKADGELTKKFNLLYQFEAQLVNGVPEKCNE